MVGASKKSGTAFATPGEIPQISPQNSKLSFKNRTGFWLQTMVSNFGFNER